jgi:pilus assembly protein CpaB
MVKGDLGSRNQDRWTRSGSWNFSWNRKRRALTIQTPNVASSVAGFILPGNKVDVLLTVTGQGINDGGGTTLTLLQAVEILAVDQRLEAPSDNKVDTKDLRSVTLLVTPEEMVKLDLGQNKGTLHLALRHLEDKAIVSPTKATLHTIGLLPPPPEPKREDQSKDQPPVEKKQNSEPPPPLLIRTIRGNQEGGVLIYPSDR